jgi:hypothetical protein
MFDMNPSLRPWMVVKPGLLSTRPRTDAQHEVTVSDVEQTVSFATFRKCHDAPRFMYGSTKGFTDLGREAESSAREHRDNPNNCLKNTMDYFNDSKE